MIKRTATCLFLCIMAVCICLPGRTYAAQVQNESVPDTQEPPVVSANSSYGLDAGSALLGIGQIVENIDSAFVYETNSDTLMYAWNPDTQIYPASLVKIMTGLIAVTEGDLDDVITVTESAVSSVPSDAVSAELKVDEQLTLRDLLYCMLMGSANDAAAVIAEHIGGSQEAFVQKMNERAANLGCRGTNFTNVHGLHNEAQYITARDAAKILDAALDNEVFWEIFVAFKYSVEKTNKSEFRNLETGNSLVDSTSSLYYDERVLGGRTGVSEDGKRCLAAVSQSNGMRIISVVMGAESVYEEDGYTAITVGGYLETKKLLDAAFNGYKTAQILYENQALIQSRVPNGDSDVVLGSQVSVSTVLPENVGVNDLSLQFNTKPLEAPIAKGENLSHLQIWYGSMCVAETDLYAMNSVRVMGQQAGLDPSEERSGLPVVVVIVLWIVTIAVVAVLTIRFAGRIRLLLIRNRSRKYRRSRRRNR